VGTRDRGSVLDSIPLDHRRWASLAGGAQAALPAQFLFLKRGNPSLEATCWLGFWVIQGQIKDGLGTVIKKSSKKNSPKGGAFLTDFLQPAFFSPSVSPFH